MGSLTAQARGVLKCGTLPVIAILTLLPVGLVEATQKGGKGGAASAPAVVNPEPVALGRLDAFWRYSAALGPFLEGGQALFTIPDYMLDTDFPYRKRSYPMEVPFADHLSIVRLLGGYDDGGRKGKPDLKVRERDLVYRDAGGKLAYRMDLLRARLKPYLDNGYTNLTLVLDNLPWCLPKEVSYGGFGQTAPPGDPKEWQQFVKALCLELKQMLGPESANQLRFRVGTENNGKERFNGTQGQFFQHYDHAAAAVKEVLPGARFGPFNISGASVRSIGELQNVKAFELAEHCFTQPNLATGRIGTPFDWVAFSRYFAPGNDPAVSAQACREIWEEFERRVPQMKGVSREIHEFGVAPFGEISKGQFPSAEPGALGAALTFQMMFHLREAGINRLWHWGVFDAFRDRKGALQHLPTGKAWMLSVLDQQTGSEAVLIRPQTASEAGTRYLGIGCGTPTRTTFILAAYHADISCHATETVSFQVPKSMMPGPGKAVRALRLNQQTSLYDQIRRDLTSAKLLKPTYGERPDRLGSVREMGEGREAERLVGDRYAEYIKLWQASLTLIPLDAKQVTFADQDGQGRLTLGLAPPEVVVLVFTP
jgi:hypothetical protein